MVDTSHGGASVFDEKLIQDCHNNKARIDIVSKLLAYGLWWFWSLLLRDSQIHVYNKNDL